MLRKNNKSKTVEAKGRFAIIASKYNAKYVDSMLRASRDTLNKAGAESVDVVRVPGAYEIPVVAARLSHAEPSYAAILCLGVVIRGETQHAQLIGEAVTHALMQIQTAREIPIIHEVLLLENEEQAKVRCLSPEHNRGAEAAQTAIEMATIMARVY
jgi:6,7-dimethyl-8-ribityllumazine synthase